MVEAVPAERRMERLVTVRDGRSDRGGVDVTTPVDPDAPLVTETIPMRRGAIVQNVRVTRQNGRVVSIAVPRDREWNINDHVESGEIVEGLDLR